MKAKKESRLRRARRTRAKIRALGIERLCVTRTNCHIYAQITYAGSVLVSASTLDKSLRSAATGNILAAAKVGAMLAKRAKEAGIAKVAFDRSGFKYHGRVKALADAARSGGLKI